MSTESSSLNPQEKEIESTKQQIRALVDEIAALSKQDLAAEEYYAEFLKRVVEALAAVGGAVWTIAEGNQLQLAYQINLRRASLDEPGDHQAHHAKLLSKVAQSREGLLVPPHSGGGDENEGSNPTELLLVLAPMQSDNHLEAIVEVFQRPTPQPNTRRGYLRFLTQMCELAGEWVKNRKLRQLGDSASLWGQVDQFARSVHDTLDLRLTSYTIANEAQRLIGCDRVSVAVVRGNKYKIEAVSGQDTFDNRSNVVTMLGRLATKVVAFGEPLWYSGSTEHMPPQLEDAVQDYVDESHSKTVAVIPLPKVTPESGESDKPEEDAAKEEEWVGALVVEQIEDLRPQQMLAPRIDLVSGHSARALTNSVHYNGLFLMPVWRTIGQARWLVRAKTLPKTVAAAIVVLALIVAMCVVPKDFDLKGSGVIQPVEQRDVFVETEGMVDEVFASHGKSVKHGDKLVQLVNHELERQLVDVRGQHLATKKQVEAIRRMIHSDLAAEEKSRLQGQVPQLLQREEALFQQVALLEEKKDQLTVRSPIDGEVITWNVKRQLKGRTVTPGQVLMTVANPSGPWELEIFMPEKRMGHVVRAQDELGKALSVNYIVATDPTTKLKGTVEDVDPSAKIHDEHGHAVSILVDINKDVIVDPRPGATATASVHCGRAPVGYVLLHELFEWFQSTVMFYF